MSHKSSIIPESRLFLPLHQCQRLSQLWPSIQLTAMRNLSPISTSFSEVLVLPVAYSYHYLLASFLTFYQSINTSTLACSWL